MILNQQAKSIEYVKNIYSDMNLFNLLTFETIFIVVFTAKIRPNNFNQ